MLWLPHLRSNHNSEISLSETGYSLILRNAASSEIENVGVRIEGHKGSVVERHTMKNQDLDLYEIGEKLAEHSKEREISARGRISELFPYIYAASKRMSTRGISEFLAENFGIKLSAVGVGRALREQDKHWERLLDLVEPSALIVSNAHNVDLENLLGNAEAFQAMSERPPRVSGKKGHAEYLAAVEFLKRRWFALDEEVRENCLAFLPKRQDDK